MFRYLTLLLGVFTTYIFSDLMRSKVVEYSELGELSTAENFLAPMWLFSISYALMLVVLLMMVIFDLRRIAERNEPICSSECDKKCRKNNHYEWND